MINRVLVCNEISNTLKDEVKRVRHMIYYYFQISNQFFVVNLLYIKFSWKTIEIIGNFFFFFEFVRIFQWIFDEYDLLFSTDFKKFSDKFLIIFFPQIYDCLNFYRFSKKKIPVKVPLEITYFLAMILYWRITVKFYFEFNYLSYY